jgi:phosphoribosylformimino-5-aminoimidazole carboxamide ribotide isomerase
MIRIIPAIDIINGQVVRLTLGKFEDKTVYHDDPLKVARKYQDEGFRYLHLVDLDGAKSGKIVNHLVIEKIANNTSLSIDFGGGIRSEQDVKLALECGADQLTVGSVAVNNREAVSEWIQKYGADRFILGADVIEKKIAISAWKDQTETGIIDFIESYRQSGITQCICTDVGRDGTLLGPSRELYTEIKAAFPQLFLIASGGVSHIDDVQRLNDDGIDAVIIGKALYEGKIGIKNLQAFLC